MNRLRKLAAKCLGEGPRPVKHAIHCRHRRQYWREASAIFVHVPRSGGTSVGHALYGRALGHMSAAEIRRFAPAEYARYFKFAFVRNPWDRVYSAFCFVKQRGTEVAGVRGAEKYATREFRDFETFVFEWLAHQNIRRLDYVFMPQHHFVADEVGNILIDYLGRTETINDDIEIINERLNAQLALKSLNQSRRESDFRQAYGSSELVDAVAKIYARDIEIFDYAFE